MQNEIPLLIGKRTHAVNRDIFCNSDTPSEKFYKFIKVAPEDLRNQNSDRPAYEQKLCIKNSEMSGQRIPQTPRHTGTRVSFWRFENTKLLNNLHV